LILRARQAICRVDQTSCGYFGCVKKINLAQRSKSVSIAQVSRQFFPFWCTSINCVRRRQTPSHDWLLFARNLRGILRSRQPDLPKKALVELKLAPYRSFCNFFQQWCV